MLKQFLLARCRDKGALRVLLGKILGEGTYKQAHGEKVRDWYSRLQVDLFAIRNGLTNGHPTEHQLCRMWIRGLASNRLRDLVRHQPGTLRDRTNFAQLTEASIKLAEEGGYEEPRGSPHPTPKEQADRAGKKKGYNPNPGGEKRKPSFTTAKPPPAKKHAMHMGPGADPKQLWPQCKRCHYRHGDTCRFLGKPEEELAKIRAAADRREAANRGKTVKFTANFNKGQGPKGKKPDTRGEKKGNGSVN
jgi:hypothetical protein